MTAATQPSPGEMKGQSFGEYRDFIRDHYDGPAGAFTAVTGFLTGHEALAGRIIRPGAFDVRGRKRLLDAACGNGRYSRNLLKHADPDAVLTSFDLSHAMLKRARARVKSPRVSHAVADLTRLPYADCAFDAIVCGWVLEHLPDAKMGLRELARVLAPGGKLLLLVTENTFTGRWCARLWHCRTYSRQELREACAACGLAWGREHYFSRLHRAMKLGGIIVEVEKQAAEGERWASAPAVSVLR